MWSRPNFSSRPHVKQSDWHRCRWQAAGNLCPRAGRMSHHSAKPPGQWLLLAGPHITGIAVTWEGSRHYSETFSAVCSFIRLLSLFSSVRLNNGSDLSNHNAFAGVFFFLFCYFWNVFIKFYFKIHTLHGFAPVETVRHHHTFMIQHHFLLLLKSCSRK